MKSHWHILVVDDEEVMRESLAAWLREDGYSVDTAASGKDGISLLKEKDYAISFIDLKMPGGIDGISVFWDRTLGFQIGRSSPFSIWAWGIYPGLPDLSGLQTVLEALLATCAVALAFRPRQLEQAIRILAADSLGHADRLIAENQHGVRPERRIPRITFGIHGEIETAVAAHRVRKSRQAGWSHQSSNSQWSGPAAMSSGSSAVNASGPTR